MLQSSGQNRWPNPGSYLSMYVCIYVWLCVILVTHLVPILMISYEESKIVCYPNIKGVSGTSIRINMLNVIVTLHSLLYLVRIYPLKWTTTNFSCLSKRFIKEGDRVLLTPWSRSIPLRYNTVKYFLFNGTSQWVLTSI